MDHSIKGQVIALAKRDPFLTVKELAEEVGTTTRYVRTILSESDLSLNEMRRFYAKSLRRSVDEEYAKDTMTIQPELTITKVTGNKVASFVPNWAELELFQASARQQSSSLCSYVELITPEELTIRTGHNSLREFLPEDCHGQLEIGWQKAAIVRAPEKLSEILDLPKQSQVLKLTTMLQVGKTPQAVEIRWFGLDGLVLEWSQLEPELKIALGT